MNAFGEEEEVKCWMNKWGKDKLVNYKLYVCITIHRWNKSFCSLDIKLQLFQKSLNYLNFLFIFYFNDFKLFDQMNKKLPMN